MFQTTNHIGINIHSPAISGYRLGGFLTPGGFQVGHLHQDFRPMGPGKSLAAR